MYILYIYMIQLYIYILLIKSFGIGKKKYSQMIEMFVFETRY